MRIKSRPAAVQLNAPHSSASRVATSYRVLVSVKDGLHRGAAFIADPSKSVCLGSSSDCDLVLMDDSVHDKSVRFFEQDGRLSAEILAPGVHGSGAEFPTGVRFFDGPAAQLRVGGAAVRVELLRCTHRQATTVAGQASSDARSRVGLPKSRNWAALTLGGLSIAAALAVVGGAVNASAQRGLQQEARTLSSVIDSFNSLGAQMVISNELGGIPRVQGLVVDAPMRGRLEHDIRAAGLNADLQLHDVRQMGESLTRLALLMGKSCEARHLGGGRFECDVGVSDQKVVSQLSALVQQVPGAVALKVNAPEPAPLATVVLPPAISAAVSTTVVVLPKLPVIRHVAIGALESFAYDSSGRRMRAGDSVDGAKVVKIRFDGVDFTRDKLRYHVAVATMATSASSPATDRASSVSPQ